LYNFIHVNPFHCIKKNRCTSTVHDKLRICTGPTTLFSRFFTVHDKLRICTGPTTLFSRFFRGSFSQYYVVFSKGGRMVGLHSWLAPKGPGPGCTRQHASTSQSAEKCRITASVLFSTYRTK
jgi:hypothetical protein